MNERKYLKAGSLSEKEYLMNTKILNENEAHVAAEILLNGGIVAIPTETVYGLAADVFNVNAIDKIFTVKGRPSDNPFIVHISEPEQLKMLAKPIPDIAYLLMEKFWPGPLTMVLPKTGIIPDSVTAGLDSVAVRLPSHPLALDVIAKAGTPLAAPSANLSGSPSPTKVAHVLMDLHGKIDAILDGGDCEVGVESTVISLLGSVPLILRPGGITYEQLAEVLGDVEIDDSATEQINMTQKVQSPGLKYRHYAPKTPLKAICGERLKTAAYIQKHATSRDAILCYEGLGQMFESKFVLEYGNNQQPASLAKSLYSALRTADAQNADVIYIQCPDSKGLGLAVSNRILKAADYDITYII